MSRKREKIIIGCFVTILVVIVAALLYAAIGMWLWNAIMVPVFAMPTLGYWQMYGIMILAKLIFGGHSTSSFDD